MLGIFWDYENCRPPSNVSGNILINNIRRLMQSSDPVKIFRAYADIALECTNPRSAVLHSELQSAGVTLVHCPHNGKKDVADKMMIVDMIAFAIDNPAPATIIIITGDRDFAYAAAVLRLRGYKILVIAPPGIGHASLKIQADDLYDWQKDVIEANNLEDVTLNGRNLLFQASYKEKKRDVRDMKAISDAKPPENLPNLARLRPNFLNSLPKSFSNPVFGIPSHPNLIPSAKYATPIDCFSKILPPWTQLSEECSKHDNSDLDASVSALASRPADSLPKQQMTNPSQPVSTSLSQHLDISPRIYSRVVKSSSNLEVDCDGDEDADGGENRCFCTICARSTGVIRSPCVHARKVSVEHSAIPKASNEQGFDPTEFYSTSLTGTPSSTSSEASPTDTFSTTLSAGNKDSAKTPSNSSIVRFLTLINVFLKQRALTGATGMRSATVASEMLKHDQNVYQNAGVDRMKQYIEEARTANVIVSPGLDNEGDCWIEINTALYSNPTLNAARNTQKATPLLSPSIPRPFPLNSPKPDVEPIFEPLVNRLRTEAPSYRLRYSVLGEFFKAEHPNLYARSDVTGLSPYLQKAEERGIVRIVNDSWSGHPWAELTPIFRRG